MAGLLGTLGQFNRDTNDWPAYCERFEQYLVANSIKDATKERAVLLSACGADTYQLIRSLVAPSKPSDKSVNGIMKLVKDHLFPHPSCIVQSFKFNSRSQRDTETVSQFVAELRKLSEFCEFGDTLEDMLRDRLVCGIRDVKVQRRLLAEANLTFGKAFELAQVAELADKNVADLQRPQATEEQQCPWQTTEVHSVNQSGSPSQN